MSLRKLASETAVYGLSSIVGRAAYFLLTPLYTAVFPEGEAGVMTAVFAAVSFALVFAGLRLDVAYFRYSGKEDEARLLGTAATVTAMVSAGIALILALGSVPLSTVLGFREYAHLFVLAGGIIGLDALSELPLARLRIQGRAWRFATVRLGGIAVNIGLSVFWLLLLPKWPDAPAWLGLGASGVTFVFLANLASSALVLLLLGRELRGARFGVDGEVLGKLWSFSGPLVIVGVSYIVNEMLDRLIFQVVWPGGEEEGLELLGVYGQNYKLAALLALFTQAFRYGVEPFVFRESGSVDAKEKYAKLAHYYLIAALLGVLVVGLGLPALSQVFLRGPGYRAGSDVVPILLCANLMLGLYYNFSVWYKVTDNTRVGAYVSVGGAAITIVLNLLLIPRYGFYGCAWATLACYTSMAAATLWLGQRRYRIPYPAGRMLGYGALALALLGLGWGLAPKLAKPVLAMCMDGGTVAEWAGMGGLAGGLVLVFVGTVAATERKAAV